MEELEKKHPENNLKIKKSFKLSASEVFANGISKESGEKLIKFSKKSREEWDEREKKQFQNH